jgi:hypothetical protein
MAKIVDRREDIPLGELLLLINSGHTVSYNSGGLTTMFARFMTRHEVAMTYVHCNGGEFVVRQATRKQKPSDGEGREEK